MKIKELMGVGDKVMIFFLPFLIIGLIVNSIYPSFFNIGILPSWLKIVVLIILMVGLVNWVWSGVLILINVPKKRLITTGPYSLVKHPLYTGMALLVLPSVGLLLNSLLGILLGIILYITSRIFSPEEENELSKTFGISWNQYVKQVKIPWL
jgi:protein-S-isoprenylcysteine O-methyltransferase Ste14